MLFRSTLNESVPADVEEAAVKYTKEHPTERVWDELAGGWSDNDEEVTEAYKQGWIDRGARVKPPSNLNEAAGKYAEGYYDDSSAAKRAAYHAFEAGAKWMAEQGVTIETKMKGGSFGNVYPDLPDFYNDGFNPEDKVIVQIREKKKD